MVGVCGAVQVRLSSPRPPQQDDGGTTTTTTTATVSSWTLPA